MFSLKEGTCQHYSWCFIEFMIKNSKHKSILASGNRLITYSPLYHFQVELTCWSKYTTGANSLLLVVVGDVYKYSRTSIIRTSIIRTLDYPNRRTDCSIRVF